MYNAKMQMNINITITSVGVVALALSTSIHRCLLFLRVNQLDDQRVYGSSDKRPSVTFRIKIQRLVAAGYIRQPLAFIDQEESMRGDPRSKDKKEVGEAFSVESMGFNMRQIMNFKTVLYIVGGIMCGVLGLTNSFGLFFYLFIGVLGSICLLVKMGFDAKRFTASSIINFLMSDLVNPNHVMSFILFWTLAYALVYIY